MESGSAGLDGVAISSASRGLFLGLPGPDNPLLSIVPAAVGALVLGLFLLLPRFVDFVERGLRSRADSSAEGETLEQEISLLRRAVFAADIIVFAGIGYWLGGMVGD